MAKEKTIIEALSQFNSREAFAKWLWVALMSFYIPAFSEERNNHIRLLINKYDCPCAVLADIYKEYVPSAKQLIFRQAIGDVLQEHGNEKDAPLSALEDLVYLIMRIKATEPLGSLLLIVKSGLLEEKERQPQILYLAMTALASSTSSSQIYELTADLISSDNFDDGYLFEAIKILVNCESSCVFSLVNSLIPRLVKLRDACKNLGGDEWTAFYRGANNCARHILKSGNNTTADIILKLAEK